MSKDARQKPDPNSAGNMHTMYVVTSQTWSSVSCKQWDTKRTACKRMSESGLEERMLSWQAVGAPVRQGASQLEWQHPAVAEVRC